MEVELIFFISPLQDLIDILFIKDQCLDAVCLYSGDCGFPDRLLSIEIFLNERQESNSMNSQMIKNSRLYIWINPEIDIPKTVCLMLGIEEEPELFNILFCDRTDGMPSVLFNSKDICFIDSYHSYISLILLLDHSELSAFLEQNSVVLYTELLILVRKRSEVISYLDTFRVLIDQRPVTAKPEFHACSRWN